MPTVLRIRGFTVFFFSEENREPAHVHVRKGGAVAKFWLEPVKLQQNDGFKKQELAIIVKILEAHQEELVRKWNEIE